MLPDRNRDFNISFFYIGQNKKQKEKEIGAQNRVLSKMF